MHFWSMIAYKKFSWLSIRLAFCLALDFFIEQNRREYVGDARDSRYSLECAVCVNGINCIGKKETISFLPSLLQGFPPRLQFHLWFLYTTVWLRFPKWKLDNITLLPKFFEFPLCRLLKSPKLLRYHGSILMPQSYFSTLLNFYSKFWSLFKGFLFLHVPYHYMFQSLSGLCLNLSLLYSLHSYLSPYTWHRLSPC